MHPEHTVYRLAHQPSDYARAHALMRRHRHATAPLGWPTVLAERDGQVLGFLATNKSDEALVAGPLWVVPGTSAIVVMRLIEAYEVVLSHAGVTFYYFHANQDREKWQRWLARLIDSGGAVETIRNDESGIWYRRTLDDDWRRGRSSSERSDRAGSQSTAA